MPEIIPKFSMTYRNGNKALWVDWGEGDHNIWDIAPRLAADGGVKNAIMSAFLRGVEAQQWADHQCPEIYVPTLAEFEEKRNG